MTKKSAGILLYRTTNKVLEVFLAHPGGPYFIQKNEGAWTIPKGEFDDEEPEVAALREFHEETGHHVTGKMDYLGETKMKSGKTIFCWAVEGDFDPATLTSNEFELEWPPHSGQEQSFPEVDRGEWFTTDVAMKKINAAQVKFIERLIQLKQSF